MKYSNGKLLAVGTMCLAWLWMGCQGATLNIPDVGTSENPLEKSGQLSKSEVWAGKILITGDVVVPEGTTLTIQPNSIVGFDPANGAHQLIVYGTLFAEGEPERFITFGSLGTAENPPTAGDWFGIFLGETSVNSRLVNCRIRHADTGVACQSDSSQVENCLMTDNEVAILCDDAMPLISHNEINKNGTAIKCVNDAAPEINRNTIQANEYGIVCDDDSRATINNNELSSNYQHAIVCFALSSPEIVSNNIFLNGGWAVYDGGRLRDNFIRGNNERGSDVVEHGTGRDGGQFYGVDEVLDPRVSPVVDAGVQRERF